MTCELLIVKISQKAWVVASSTGTFHPDYLKSQMLFKKNEFKKLISIVISRKKVRLDECASWKPL